AFGTYERMSFALGAAGGKAGLDAIGDEITDLIDASSYMGFVGKAKAVPKLARLACALPVPALLGAPCKEVVDDDPDLNALPVLT
ncbi:menaquinone biosynthesis decarboxylase, partial [Citrobacter sp. AAK_AS5]